jgi:opacity protein-like surface antigen
MRLVYAAFLTGMAAPALAADFQEPVPYEPAPVVEPAPEYNGWYIRGDAAYRWSELDGADYITYGCDECGSDPGTNKFNKHELDGALTLGVGVGYQITNYLRTDLTADYLFDSDFDGSTSDGINVSTDSSSYSAFLLLANAYVDLGTYSGFTPYIGAGIGGAHVKWDDLRNTFPGVDDVHEGSENWRFAFALMAGASYCLTDKLTLDGGYRYTRVEGGRMFEEHSPDGVSIGVGPGFDDGFNLHEVRAGLRYNFGGNRNCAQPVAYEPPVEPVVYKQ